MVGAGFPLIGRAFKVEGALCHVDAVVDDSLLQQRTILKPHILNSVVVGDLLDQEVAKDMHGQKLLLLSFRFRSLNGLY